MCFTHVRLERTAARGSVVAFLTREGLFGAMNVTDVTLQMRLLEELKPTEPALEAPLLQMHGRDVTVEMARVPERLAACFAGVHFLALMHDLDVAQEVPAHLEA